MAAVRDPRKAFEQKLVALANENQKIFALSCDSASGGGLSSFFSLFPERAVEVGISEQNAVGIAAAMSRQGLIPVLVIINPFLTMRAFEQVRDDLGYMNSNVKIVGSGGGLAYSTLGSTHIAIEDVALMRTVPNLTILAPGDAGEVEAALERAMEIIGPVYIRMPRQPRGEPAGRDISRIRHGKAEALTQGDDVALITYGPSVEEALKAADLLAAKQIGVTVVDAMTIKPLDTAEIQTHICGKKAVFTLEEHIPTGGIGSAVAELMASMKEVPPLYPMGVPEGAKQTGPYEELLAYYRLDGASVAEYIWEKIQEN